eukprot:1161023-Pelagomonas_calceolata.AAC.13
MKRLQKLLFSRPCKGSSFMSSHPSGPTMQPMLLRGGNSFLTWAVLKLKDLELEELMDPTAKAPGQGGPKAGEGHKGACRSCYTKPGRAGAGGVDRRAE